MSATQYMDPSKREQIDKESTVRLDRLNALRALESSSSNSGKSSSSASENSSEFEERMTQGSPADDMTQEHKNELKKMGISPIHTPTATFNPPLSSSSSLTPTPTPSLTPSPKYNLPKTPSHAHPVHMDMEMPDAPTHEVDFTPRQDRDQFTVLHEEDRDALNNFGDKTPDYEKNPEAYNRNLEDFLRFYKNPTLSRNRRPFAQGRRTKRCKRCQRCKTCKRTRQYCRKNKGKRRTLRKPSYKRKYYKK